MLPAQSTPAACMISLVGRTARVASPAATIAAAPVPRGVTSTLIISAMPSRGKRSVVSQIPLVLPGTAMVLALSRTCLKASTVLTSGFGVPARTATPTPTRARSTSVPATILLAAISSSRPSLDRITTSHGTPRASCAAIVCGPVPCDAPDPVTTLMPLVRSNSGSNSSYAPLNPPEIRTFTCATSYSRSALLRVLSSLSFEHLADIQRLVGRPAIERSCPNRDLAAAHGPDFHAKSLHAPSCRGVFPLSVPDVRHLVIHERAKL